MALLNISIGTWVYAVANGNRYAAKVVSSDRGWMGRRYWLQATDGGMMLRAYRISELTVMSAELAQEHERALRARHTTALFN